MRYPSLLIAGVALLCGMTSLGQAQMAHRWEQQGQLIARLRGFYQYFGLYHCWTKLDRVRREIFRQWIWALHRPSQRHRLGMQTLETRAWFALPKPRLIHPTV